MEPDFSYPSGPQDARIDFFLSEDRLTLTADFFPASPKGRLLVFSEVESFLHSQGVEHGLLKRELQEAIRLCNTTRQPQRQVVVARGTPPEKEVPAYWRLESGLFQDHRAQEGRVDWKEWSPFVIVREHQLLARAIAPRPGKDGMTVLGQPIPHGKKEVTFLLPGRNTLLHGGEVYAKISGRLVQDRQYFHVDDYLEVEEVGWATGHIRFPGHVLVRRGVMEGFRLWAGGDLRVGETLDATDVYAHGNLQVKGGILGKGRGLVRVGGKLEADWIENARVDVLGGAVVKKAILHAEVLINGDLMMGESGKVVQSYVCVKGDCHLAELGTDAGPARLTVGVDFVLKRRTGVLQLALTELENTLRALEALPAEDPEVQRRLAEVRQDMERKLAELNELRQAMIKPDSVLRVSGTIHVGSIVEIGAAVMEIRERMSRKQFRLGSDGHVVVEDLSPRRP